MDSETNVFYLGILVEKNLENSDDKDIPLIILQNTTRDSLYPFLTLPILLWLNLFSFKIKTALHNFALKKITHCYIPMPFVNFANPLKVLLLDGSSKICKILQNSTDGKNWVLTVLWTFFVAFKQRGWKKFCRNY